MYDEILSEEHERTFERFWSDLQSLDILKLFVLQHQGSIIRLLNIRIEFIALKNIQTWYYFYLNESYIE